MRVIAGTARGRLLNVAPALAIRPTSDLVRGAIFSMLEAEALKRGFEPDEEGLFAGAVCWPRVLDLFAGSGALGIEALSRGAAHATFVEQERTAGEMIAQNLRRTRLHERASILVRPVVWALGAITEEFDLILADPPYDEPSLAVDACVQLSRDGRLAPGGILVLEERASSPPVDLQTLSAKRVRRHGQTRITMFERRE